ncbi:MAG: CusA/CzcA family heavy metal efflux RND transporter [Phenylobacterium sp.]|uniref:efflux RND transporter permease subunit n=1 Tax=Phenylobacterium sp. TaxID=1871053 RepID=UPI001A3EA2BC|nr:CusA/CzcA family heavy metal efflux RND transporter [Phenylobacterium sp.]MBL8552887.1 CusA/CzcA family heavy metal efflux RND transporter [Phenylobacterium sp.]
MLSKIVAFSVRHRIAVVLVTLLVAGFGVSQLFRLPIDAVPDITNKQVQVTTISPALSPEEIEQQVTFPVETSLGGIPGLVETRSISRNGFSQITAVFQDSTDLYFARQQVNERIEAVREDLPANARPEMAPVTTGLGEVLMWTVEMRPVKGQRAGAPGPQPDGSYITPEGDRLVTERQKATYLRTVQDWIVTPQLRTTAGVAGIDTIGGYVKEYVVYPDAARLSSYGVGLNELVEAVQHANTVAGAGNISRGGEAFVVRADARVTSLRDLAAAPVTNRKGLVVRVSDVASVEIGQAVRLGAAQENGQEVVIGTALMLAGENSRTVARAVSERLTQIAPSLPPGIAVKTVLNRTDLVDRTIHTVQRNLAEGALLVIAVLFFLLGNVRAAVITALVIPLAFLIGVIGMNRFGVSGNLMSLGALDFGILVDGAVVVVENTLTRMGGRRESLGRDLTPTERLEEAVAAARQMVRPAAFGQAIILLVYAPLLALEGIEGKMFQPMAATVMLALAAAFVLTFTFVPAMTALLIRAPTKAHESKAEAFARRGFEPATRWAIARPKQIAIGAVIAVVVGLVTFFSLGREFIPTLDEKDILLQAVRVPSASLEQSVEMQGRLERALLRIPEVAFVFSKTGTAEVSTDPMPPSFSDTYIVLKDSKEWPDRSLSKADISEKIEKVAGGQIGNAYEFTQPIQMRFNELISGVRSDIAVKVYGDDFAAMQRTADQIADVLRKTRGAADVRVEQVSGLPMITAEVDRASAAAYGLHAADAADAVQIALAGREAGRVFEGDRRFDVVVRLPDSARNDLAAVAQTPLAVNGGTTFVPLGSVVRFREGEGPNQISRENGKRRIVVSANVRGRDLGGFVNEAQAAVGKQVALPAGSWLDWGGQFENLQRAEARLAIVVPVVFALIAVLLYFALGSVSQAALVFGCVPLALVGGALALLFRGMPFSVSAAVGFIAVSGVATLNGLVLIQSVRERLEAGDAPEVAAVEGAMGRLRAVLTTALVAILGFMPMALAHGAGAEVQKPLATVVIGGLITATFLTLVVLPTFASRVLARKMGAGRSPALSDPVV